MKERIPIFFTFDKNYAVAAAVTFYSLLKNANTDYSYDLYILYTDLPLKAQKALNNVVKAFNNASITFIDTTHYYNDDSINIGKSHFSKEIYCKLIASEIFPQYKRILCSDVDVIFTNDISDAYFMFQDDFFYFAGVGQILKSKRMESYGNDFSKEELTKLEKEVSAGFILINLEAIREKDMQHKLVSFYVKNYHRLRLPEQDCIAICCYPHIKNLPIEYVVLNSWFKLRKIEFHHESPITSQDEFKERINHPIQLHYVGPSKPWNDFFVPKQKLWFSLLIEANLFPFFLYNTPLFIKQKYKQYSIKRFIKKLFKMIH